MVIKLPHIASESIITEIRELCYGRMAGVECEYMLRVRPVMIDSGQCWKVNSTYTYCNNVSARVAAVHSGNVFGRRAQDQVSLAVQDG
jgi:hypothetical protein